MEPIILNLRLCREEECPLGLTAGEHILQDVRISREIVKQLVDEVLPKIQEMTLYYAPPRSFTNDEVSNIAVNYKQIRVEMRITEIKRRGGLHG